MFSTSSAPSVSGPNAFQRMAMPTSGTTTDTAMSPPNSASDTGSPAKACTDCTMPERVMKVATMTKVKARHAHMTAQRLKAPRCRYTVKVCTSATHTSHDSRLAFSTGSQPQ